MPGSSPTSYLSSWLHQIWHLPDKMSWMNPLPALHRRGLIAAALVILLAFLWPSTTPQRAVQPVTSMQSGDSATEELFQAEIIDNPPPTTTPVSAPTQTSPTQQDSQGQWHEYLIASGQTLAQLFRDNNLPVDDVFAMARVEGNDKPLSMLQAGQTVKIRQDALGVVTGLTLDSGHGEILFTRQPDGTFFKAQ